MSLAQMTCYGAILIVAIIIIRALALHRLPKKTFVVLWCIALLRLLLPVSVPSEFSLYSVLPIRVLMQNMVPEGKKAVFTEDPLPNPMITPTIFDDTQTSLDTSADYFVPPAPTTVSAPGLVLPIAGRGELFLPLWNVFWALGFLFVSAFFTVTYFRCRREFSTSLPIKNSGIQKWQEAHPLARTYEIRQSDKISAPLTYGILHPVILLPKSIDFENEKQLHYVLLHEYTHIRHLDTLTKLLTVFAVCLHWFNPFVWILYVFFNRDIEFYCDECVMSAESGDARSAYANTLIRMEESRSFSIPLCNHFSKTAIEERIASVMKSKKATLGMIFSGVLIVAFVTITLFTSPRQVQGNSGLPNFPVPTATPTPTPRVLITGPTVTPTVTPTAVPTVAPDAASHPRTQLTDGEFYHTATMLFEQFRQTMNTDVYRWEYYPENYSLTVWQYNEKNIVIEYQFMPDGFVSESGILSLYETDGTWRVVAFLPNTTAE